MADRPFTVTRAKIHKALSLLMSDAEDLSKFGPDEMHPARKARMKRCGVWDVKGPPPRDKALDVMTDSLIAYLKEH